MPTRQIIVEVVPHRGKRLSQPLTRLQDHRVEIEERLKQLGIQITGPFVPSWSRNGYSLLIAVGQVTRTSRICSGRTSTTISSSSSAPTWRSRSSWSSTSSSPRVRRRAARASCDFVLTYPGRHAPTVTTPGGRPCTVMGGLVVVCKGATVNSRHVELDPFEELPPSVRVALGRSDDRVVTLPDAERRVDLWLDDELR